MSGEIGDQVIAHANLFAVIKERRALQREQQHQVLAGQRIIVLAIPKAVIHARRIMVAQGIAGPGNAGNAAPGAFSGFHAPRLGSTARSASAGN